jgi:dTDP-4-amino-4,6-dideoxygalactose transaminase
VPIPLIDVKAQYTPFLPQIRAKIDEVLESGAFILGPNVKAFEQESAAYLGVHDAIGVANGTDAISLVLDALEIGAGDEVICPAFTFYATAEPVAKAGARPVFVDIDPVTLNLDPAQVAAKITSKTKAIIPVHLFGRPAALEALREAAGDIPLIEDAAQAFGAAGIATTGVASTFSFFPTKNLFCLGDGGLIAVRDDEELSERIRMLRFHGSKAKKTFEYVGVNSRLDELQAAVLRVFLQQIDTWNAQRREAARRYAELGLGELVELPEDAPGHVYHLFVTRSTERDRIAEALGAAGIASASHYVVPLHLQPVFTALGYREGDLPETEKAARENLCLPLWAGISAEQQEQVVETVRAAVGAPVA